MEQVLFEELIEIVNLFWRRYAELPFTSRYSGYSRAAYFKQSNAMLSTLLQFCIASNFVRLDKHSIQSLLKHRFSVEYHLFFKTWKWIEADKLSEKYKQNILDHLSYYIRKVSKKKINPQIIGINIISSPEATHYICGIMRRFQTKEKLIFFLYAIENQYTSDIQPNFHFTDKKKLKQAYKQYFENPTQNLSEYIRQQGFRYKGFQKSFQECFGVTFYQYFLQHRLLRSLELLMFTDKSHKVIAHECGFSDYSHYIKTFKRLSGLNLKDIPRFVLSPL